MRRLATEFAILAAFLLLISLTFSCSTTRLLDEGEYRLVKNEIIVQGDPDGENFEVSKISPYIKQKPSSSWNPMLYVYNWSGRDSSWLSNTLRKIGSAPVVYNSEQVRTSSENMARQMEYLGYYKSSVQPRIKVKGKKATVQYLVHPGHRYRIRSIGFDLPESPEFREIFYKDSSNISISKGEYLSVAALEAESIRAASYLRNNGYFDIDKNAFSFIADTLAMDGMVDLVMNVALKAGENEENVQESAPLRYKFGSVTISYPSSIVFRKKALTDLNTIKPGQPYSENAINTTYSRLASIGALGGVTVTLNRSAKETGVVDCGIELTPAKQRGVKLNLEGSSNSNGLIGISPEITYYSRNIFRGGETLNLSFLGDWQFKPGTDIKSTEFGISGSINFPRFLLLPSKYFRGRVPSTQIKASVNSQDRPEYQRDLFSTSYTYIWSQGRLYYQFTPVGISLVRLHNIDDSFYESMAGNPFLRNAYQNHLDIGSSMTIYYTTDASVVPSGAYRYARLQVDLSGNVLSAFNSMLSKNADGASLLWKTPYSQYIRGELSLGRTWELWGNTTLASRVLMGAGYAYGNSTVLPFEKHFYSGGANSLRGWQARAVGPGYESKNSTFVIPSQTGDMKLEANAELRFGIWGMVSGATFVDVGNIWTINKNISGDESGKFRMSDLPGSLAADWGIGIRFNFHVLLLRLDMGMKLHDPSRAHGDRWIGPGKWLHSGGNAIHLGVGYPF